MRQLERILRLVRIVKSSQQATANPWLSVALSLWLPGLGHFQVGANRIGMTLIAAWSLTNVIGMYVFWGTQTVLSRMGIVGWLAVQVLISVSACVTSYVRAKGLRIVRDGPGLPVRSLSLAMISPLFGYWSIGHKWFAVTYLAVLVFWNAWATDHAGMSSGIGGMVLYHAPHLVGLAHLGLLLARQPRGRAPVLAIRRVVIGLGAFALIAHAAYWSHWNWEGLGSFRIRSDGMAPAVREGDWVITRSQNQYDRFDAVVYDGPNDKQLVRRIVAIPGDRMSWEGGRLSINGMVIRDGIRGPEDSGGEEVEKFGPVFVLPNTYWVAGDNQRFRGAGLTLIRMEDIRGRAWRMISPAGRAKIF